MVVRVRKGCRVTAYGTEWVTFVETDTAQWCTTSGDDTKVILRESRLSANVSVHNLYGRTTADAYVERGPDIEIQQDRRPQDACS